MQSFVRLNAVAYILNSEIRDKKIELFPFVHNQPAAFWQGIRDYSGFGNKFVFYANIYIQIK